MFYLNFTMINTKNENEILFFMMNTLVFFNLFSIIFIIVIFEKQNIDIDIKGNE